MSDNTEMRVVADGEQGKEAPRLRICADDEEEVHAAPEDAAEAKPSKPGAGLLNRRKRKSTDKVVSMEDLAARIKKLQDEADQAEAVVKEMEATIVAKRDEAKAKRQEAARAASDFVKKQCEVALAKLEAAVPKRVTNPFFLFLSEERQSAEYVGFASSEVNRRISQKWAGLSEEGKKVYKDKFDVENKKWQEWGTSEEGKRILAERSDIIRQCKATQVEQLAEAMGPTEMSGSTPRLAEMEASLETPAKKKRASGAAVAAPAQSEPSLDEKIVALAEKADLLPQLKNLVSRPDVQALKKTSQELWDALLAHSGMVNATKRALLG